MNFCSDVGAEVGEDDLRARSLRNPSHYEARSFSNSRIEVFDDGLNEFISGFEHPVVPYFFTLTTSSRAHSYRRAGDEVDDCRRKFSRVLMRAYKPSRDGGSYITGCS